MMYINIKKLYSWRIRPYKIPSFFFPLLFPFFSLFSSLFFFPPFSFLPPSWCASVPQLWRWFPTSSISGSIPEKSLTHVLRPRRQNTRHPTDYLPVSVCVYSTCLAVCVFYVRPSFTCVCMHVCVCACVIVCACVSVCVCLC